jgi:hypothetical protein
VVCEDFGEASSFEGWVALQQYPWNWAAIVNQERDHKEGWFFAISGGERAFRKAQSSVRQMP